MSWIVVLSKPSQVLFREHLHQRTPGSSRDLKRPGFHARLVFVNPRFRVGPQLSVA